VIIGDVMLGVVWDRDVMGMVLRVPRTILVESKHYEYQDAAANHYDVPSVPSNHWEEIVGRGDGNRRSLSSTSATVLWDS